MTTKNDLKQETEATESTVSDEQRTNEQPPAQDTKATVEQPDSAEGTSPEGDTQDNTETPDDEQQTQDDDKSTAELKKARNEAAKYRSRLRETEEQLEATKTVLDTARRQVLWDIHTTLLNGQRMGGNQYSIVPQALTDVLGDDVSGFFNDDGGINQTAYKEHLQATLAAKPYLFNTQTALTQHELDQNVLKMIQDAGKSTDNFQNALMGRPNY